MNLRFDYLNFQYADSLYIGGGTPSLLQPVLLERIIEYAKKVFGLNPNVEITLEANPNNLHEEYMKQLADTSINRLSIGIQSFFDDNLQLLGRIHTGKQAETALDLAAKYRFFNLSVDLMYAYPGLTADQWSQNMEKVKTVNHLSCYSLSLAPSSLLYRQIEENTYRMPDEKQEIEQYKALLSLAKNNYFIHYEISNFCKQDQFSRHNTAYWKREPYIGLGVAAHSFNGFQRQWNKADISYYIQQIKRMNTPQEWKQQGLNTLFEQETLSPIMQLNEYIMTSLRTIEGCDLQYVQDCFGTDFYAVLKTKLKYIRPQYYTFNKDILKLNETGRLLTDGIASDLFFEEL